MQVKDHDIIIVGGGISGLFLAYRLLMEDPKIRLLIIEKGKEMGGKLQTEYSTSSNNEIKTVLYEKGPWRISTSHTHMIRLCHNLGVPLHPFPENIVDGYYDVNTKRYSCSAPATQNPTNPGLSAYDELILHRNRSVARDKEDRTGYPDILDMTSVIDVYEAQNPSSYLCLLTGFSGLIQALVNTLKALENQCSFLKEALVTDVVYDNKKKHYRLSIQKREGSNEFHERTEIAPRVVLACPPSSFQDWSIADYMRPLLASVRPVSLHHIYAMSPQRPLLYNNNIDNFHINTNSALCQIISSPYPTSASNHWFMVSYSSGRIADFWERLCIAHPLKFREKLRKEASTFLGKTQTRALQQIKNYYWKEAIHEWTPSFGMDMKRMYRLAMIPDPIHLPDLFIIGEAFSPLQGWCEGALETVENLLAEIVHPSPPVIEALPIQHVIYRSRVLDVHRWMSRHPGGAQALENHLGEDITQLWDSIHNTLQSKAMIAALQVGWQHSPTTMIKLI